jgi:hypothetical protein
MIKTRGINASIGGDIDPILRCDQRLEMASPLIVGIVARNASGSPVSPLKGQVRGLPPQGDLDGGQRAARLRPQGPQAGAIPTDDERVRATARGIRRTIGVAKTTKAPATNDKLLAMVALRDCSLAAFRDRALLLLGFAGAFRRSELVALDVADIERTAQGLRITIRQSKTDQEGAGQTIAVVRGSVVCPIDALKAWLSKQQVAVKAVA